MSFASVIEREPLLGKYRVESVIGRGGMGLVLRAWHLGLDEEVAIKMLRDDIAIADETIARFVREAQAAAKLKSEHVARIIDVGTFHDGKPFLVMELLEGQDIGQVLAERGRLQPSLAIDLVIQACEALAEAHSLGIVHRDIKPSNLFLTSRPDGSVLLKILDFGISKSMSGAELSLTQTWSLLGSPAYMSPEQMRSARHVDARSDIWSLGAVLYEMIEGRLPFQAASFSEMCVMVAVDPPGPMTAAPADIAPIIARCLAKNPADRYASVADLARELAGLAREPDKAQALVDRMYRMLQRGARRRTPPAGVPRRPSSSDIALAPGTTPTGLPVPTPRGLPVPTPRGLPVPTPRGLPVPTPRSLAVPAPAGFAAASPAARTPTDGGAAPDPAPGSAIPVSIPYAGSSPHAGIAVPRSPAVTRPPSVPPGAPAPPSAPAGYPVPPPLVYPSPPPLVYPASAPAYAPAYAYGASPGTLASRSSPPPAGARLQRGVSLTTTQVIVRRDRGWMVTLITAVIALAAATAVLVATRSQPFAPREPASGVIRVIPKAAPAASSDHAERLE